MKTEKYEIVWLYRHIPIVTYCDIYEGDILISTGDARCNPSDHFCRNNGRKLSLARALKQANIPKEERKSIWTMYRNMTVKKRW
jgi:hypothetical protein